MRRSAMLAAIALSAAAIAIPAASASAAAPTTLYVQNNTQICSDTGPGSQANPFCTVQAAANIVNPGDTVALMTSGLALAPATLTRSGAVGAPITFTTATPGALFVPQMSSTTGPAVLTLSGVHDIAISSIGLTRRVGQTAVVVQGSQRVSLTSIQITGQSGTTGTAAGVDVDGASSDIAVTRSRFSSMYGGPGVRVRSGARTVTIATNAMSAMAAGAVAIDGTAGAAVTGNSVSGTGCHPLIAITGASTATVENNVVDALAPSTACAVAGPVALQVAAGSTTGTTADYNAVYAAPGAVQYSWNGASHATLAAFRSATGQGAHDLESAQPWPISTPAENSPLIDSANDAAPGQTAVDWYGNARVDDPLVANTGSGTSRGDRGAAERQDVLGLNQTVTPLQGVGPLPVTVTVTSSGTSAWGRPITFSADFGDGTPTLPVTPGVAGAHTYSAGTFTETTTARTAAGTVAHLNTTIVVGTAAAPTATFTVAATPAGTPLMPALAHVTVGVARDAWEVSAYTVSWGDGTILAVSPGTIGHQYPAPGTYTATLTVTDRLQRNTTSSVTVTVGDVYLPTNPGPTRVFDSRSWGISSVPAHTSITLTLADYKTFTKVDAVVVNVTVTNAKKAGYVSVVPQGATANLTSNVNFIAGQTVANLVAASAVNASVSFYNGSAGPIDLIVDSMGVMTRGQGGHDFQPLGPTRVADTRSGLGAAKTPVSARRNLTVQVAGANGVPANASVAVLNVTTTNTKAPGYLVAYDHAAARPAISNSNWVTGQTVSNLVVVPLTDGKVVLSNQSGGTVDVVADVVGYYTYLGPGSAYLPTLPQRLLNTNAGIGTGGKIAKLQPGQSAKVQVAGLSGRPAAGITAATFNLTAFNATTAGFVTAYPDGGSASGTSSVNYTSGRTVANMTVVPVGTSGAIVLKNGGSAAVDLIVDLNGYYYPIS